MSNYILYKKTPCGDCGGIGKRYAVILCEDLNCNVCLGRGHTLTEVDLVDVLRELGVKVNVFSAQELYEDLFS
jgi:hypothetical protein